jgi:hypothetical protein
MEVKPPLQSMPSAAFDNVADGNQLVTNRDFSPMDDRGSNVPPEGPGIPAQGSRGEGFVTTGQEERIVAQFPLFPVINDKGIMK